MLKKKKKKPSDGSHNKDGAHFPLMTVELKDMETNTKRPECREHNLFVCSLMVNKAVTKTRGGPNEILVWTADSHPVTVPITPSALPISKKLGCCRLGNWISGPLYSPQTQWEQRVSQATSPAWRKQQMPECDSSSGVMVPHQFPVSCWARKQSTGGEKRAEGVGVGARGSPGSFLWIANSMKD